MTNEIMKGKREKEEKSQQTTEDNIPVAAEYNTLLPFSMQPGVGPLAASKLK
jgi:hypothetical protein